MSETSQTFIVITVITVILLMLLGLGLMGLSQMPIPTNPNPKPYERRVEMKIDMIMEKLDLDPEAVYEN